MPEQVILPATAKEPRISKASPAAGITLGTTRGLAKPANEDRVGYFAQSDLTRLCISDGHWGDSAADMIVRHWLNDSLLFRGTRDAAVAETKVLEHKLFTTYGPPQMDEKKDRTPEAAFIALELRGMAVRLVSYGDCRMLITREEE